MAAEAGAEEESVQLNVSFKTLEDSSSTLPLFLGKVLSHDFSGLFPDVRGSVGILQLVHVHVEGHGVCRW